MNKNCSFKFTGRGAVWKQQDNGLITISTLECFTVADNRDQGFQ